jgi:hypothetical protein
MSLQDVSIRQVASPPSSPTAWERKGAASPPSSPTAWGEGEGSPHSRPLSRAAGEGGAGA